MSSSSTARRSAVCPTTWCCGRATPRRLIRGSRPSTLQTARSGSLSTRLQHPAALGPPGLTSVPVRRRSRRRPPLPLCSLPCFGPAPLAPARMGCGGSGPSGPRLHSPLLVAGTRAGSSGASCAAASGPRSHTHRRCLYSPDCVNWRQLCHNQIVPERQRAIW